MPDLPIKIFITIQSEVEGISPRTIRVRGTASYSLKNNLGEWVPMGATDSLSLTAAGPDGGIINGTVAWGEEEGEWLGSLTIKIEGSHIITASASQSWEDDFGVHIKHEKATLEFTPPDFELPDYKYRTFLRLEPRCRVSDNDFSRGLEARLADPLWLMARQWQLGEFQAEDAGSPVEVQLTYSTQAVTTVQLGTEVPQYLQDTPLEMMVEQEWLKLDWRRRVQIGQRFERLIKELDPGSIDKYRETYPLQPTADERAQMDKATVRFIDFMAGRVIDGQKLLDERPIKRLENINISAEQIAEAEQQLNAWCDALNIHHQPSHPAAWRTEPLDYRFELNPSQENRLIPRQATRALGPVNSFMLGIFKRFWEALHALLGLVSQKSPLVAPSYRNGELDWYTFDTNGPLKGFWLQPDTITLCPTRVSIGGTSYRWWTFEDAGIDFGSMDVSKTDLSKLALMEFVLAYGDDWFSVPLPVEMGNLVTIDEFKVINVFGEAEVHNAGTHPDATQTALNPASRLDDDPMRRWQIFALSPSESGRPAGDAPGFGNLLFIPPMTGIREESPPLEEVLFLRDEGANMVWGGESTVCNGLGEPVEGSGAHREKAERDRRAMIAQLEQELLLLFAKLFNAKSEFERQMLRAEYEAVEEQLAWLRGEQQATVSGVPRYRLASTVPEQWIPFMPAKPVGSAKGVIRLCRAQMLRNRDDEMPVTIEALSRLLELTNETDEEQRLWYLEEATVPRSGLRYQLTVHRARDTEGNTRVWIGRKVLAGRGEGSSGLRFDVLI